MRRFLLFISVLMLALLFVGCSFSEFIGSNAIAVGKVSSNDYKVVFDSNGGTYVNTMRTQVISSVPFTKKEGYTFEGWYYNEGFTRKVIFPVQVNSNMTLYAKWTPIYTVTFVTNGGTYVNTMQTKVIDSAPYTKKAGYIFDGWYYNEGLTQKVMFPAQVNADMTLYAKWTPIYTVRFATNGGSYVDAKQTQRITEAPYTEREGYLFAGWYYNEGLSNEVVYPIEVRSDMTLYAKWLLLEKETSCKATKLKFMDSDYSSCAYYSLSPGGFDFYELEKRGYYISIEVQYDVKYKNDYNVTLDIGYFGSPKYKVGIINEEDLGVWQTDLGTSKSSTTRSISNKMTVAKFNKNHMYLYFATENVQNVVCFDDITVTYRCYK